MKNEGYTLIELLAILVILGVIIMISVPSITGVINSSKDQLYDEQVRILENAARTYMSENSTLLPDDGNSEFVKIKDLIDDGIISEDKIKNPKKNQYFEGCIKVTNTNNKFTYIYQDNCNL